MLKGGPGPQRRSSARARRRAYRRIRTWGDPDGAAVFIGHGTPGSRLDRYPGVDDPEWVRGRRLRFIGVDRPGYGYSDPWPEASLLDCARDFVRVADNLSLERFAALGVSGGAPYVIALGALAPERLVRIAVVSGADIGMDQEETPEELAGALGEEARILREDPEEWYAGFMAEVTEVDHRVLERPEVRAVCIEMFQEVVRQGAVGWVDDVLRLGRTWPFRLDKVVVRWRGAHGPGPSQPLGPARDHSVHVDGHEQGPPRQTHLGDRGRGRTAPAQHRGLYGPHDPRARRVLPRPGLGNPPATLGGPLGLAGIILTVLYAEQLDAAEPPQQEEAQEERSQDEAREELAGP